MGVRMCDVVCYRLYSSHYVLVYFFLVRVRKGVYVKVFCVSKYSFFVSLICVYLYVSTYACFFCACERVALCACVCGCRWKMVSI